MVITPLTPKGLDALVHRPGPPCSRTYMQRTAEKVSLVRSLEIGPNVANVIDIAHASTWTEVRLLITAKIEAGGLLVDFAVPRGRADGGSPAYRHRAHWCVLVVCRRRSRPDDFWQHARNENNCTNAGGRTALRVGDARGLHKLRARDTQQGRAVLQERQVRRGDQPLPAVGSIPAC